MTQSAHGFHCLLLAGGLGVFVEAVDIFVQLSQELVEAGAGSFVVALIEGGLGCRIHAV
ncbi:MAG: hypothetical protein BWY75_00550 [bacterium ADurb.Bin425]|nr:MAG: hypothetical protein BWY75_00550 [bacterium ADurb.Bin425]